LRDCPLLTSIITQNHHNDSQVNSTDPFYDYRNVWDEIKNKHPKEQN